MADDVTHAGGDHLGLESDCALCAGGPDNTSINITTDNAASYTINGGECGAEAPIAAGVVFVCGEQPGHFPATQHRFTLVWS